MPILLNTMTYQLKTKVTDRDVVAFIKASPHEKRKEDALRLLEIFARATQEVPVIWSGSADTSNGIVGYGSYETPSSCKGGWMRAGFSLRKSNLVVYIMTGFKKYDALTTKLDKFKTSVSCLYINKLADIDLIILEKINFQRLSIYEQKISSLIGYTALFENPKRMSSRLGLVYLSRDVSHPFKNKDFASQIIHVTLNARSGKNLRLPFV